jgi:hypothetical protein
VAGRQIQQMTTDRADHAAGRDREDAVHDRVLEAARGARLPR